MDRDHNRSSSKDVPPPGGAAVHSRGWRTWTFRCNILDKRWLRRASPFSPFSHELCTSPWEETMRSILGLIAAGGLLAARAGMRADDKPSVGDKPAAAGRGGARAQKLR